MPFYRIELRTKCKYNWSKSGLVYTNILSLNQFGETIILIFQDGTIVLVKSNDPHIKMQAQIYNNGKLTNNILSVTECDQFLLIETYKGISFLLTKQVLSMNEDNLQAKTVEFDKHNNMAQQYSKLTSKQAKFIKYKEKTYLKLVGRLNQQFFYYFCQIDKNRLLLKQFYRCHLGNEYKVSLQGLYKDLIIYESYINKFKPIKTKILSFFSQNQSNDSALIKQLQIVQFEQRCTVNNAYLIGLQLVCLVTNSHFQQSCQSNIIIYNYLQKYTINNIVVKDTIIIQSFLFGNKLIDYLYNDNTLSLQCIALVNEYKCLIHIFPLCTYQPQPTLIYQSNYQKVQQNSLVIYNQQQGQLSIYGKISKKAIYYSWLQQKFSQARFIFNDIIQLLD